MEFSDTRKRGLKQERTKKNCEICKALKKDNEQRANKEKSEILEALKKRTTL